MNGRPSRGDAIIYNTHNMLDPIRELTNFLQEVHIPENLAPFLQFSSVQSGPNHRAIHTGMYTFRGIIVGTGSATSISSAKHTAASRALQYLRANGVPDDMSDPVHDLNSYLQVTHFPENLVPYLRFTSVQSGPNNNAMHHVTYTFRDVVVDTSSGTAISIAKRGAATQALQYFRTHGIPDEIMMSDPVRGLSNYLQAARSPENLVPYLRFASVPSGPNIDAMHYATYTFCDVVVGRASGTVRGIAKRNAAMQALQYFRTQGIPPIPELCTVTISVG